MSMAMEKEQLESVGDYVKSHLAEWIGDIGESRLRLVRSENDNTLGERIVRVEEGIKSQIEIFNRASEESEKRFTLIREEMTQRFNQVDKQFEKVDKQFELMQENMDRRFEQVDKRFEQVDKQLELIRENMDRRFEQVDKRFDKSDNRFKALIGFLVTIFVSLIGGFTILVVQLMNM